MARAVETHPETASARTIGFEVDGWPGHLPGQHVAVRLTAQDGYAAQRDYSIAGPSDGNRLELTVQRVNDGEVSEYLVDDLLVGDEIEVRGPVGGWFVWYADDPTPVLLVAGGSGVVPLMAMVRQRSRSGRRTPFRLIYSVRTPDDVYYADELRHRARDDRGLDVTVLFTRSAPDGERRAPGRITMDDLSRSGWPPEFGARIFICGPTGFVETAARHLLAIGHAASRIRTERFGPSGG